MCDEGSWFRTGSGLGTWSLEETKMFPHVGGQRRALPTQVSLGRTRQGWAAVGQLRGSASGARQLLSVQ